MTQINQLPTTLQAISLADLGVISQSTSAGAVAVQAPLSGIAAPMFAAPPPLGATPNSGSFTTLTASTSFLIGTGTLSGSAYQFQSALNLDPSAGASNSHYRENMANTTLTYTSGAQPANTVEAFNSFVTVNGPNNAQGEINAMHAYVQINSGVVVTQIECIEASASNSGSVTTWDGVLSIVTNGPSATAASLNGLVVGLTNQNTAAASIGNYTGFYMGAMIGSSIPTDYYAIHNADSNASINTLGGVVIGSNTPQAGPASYYQQTADNSSGTYGFQIKNLSGSNLLYMNNAGNLTVTATINTTSGQITSGAAVVAATVLNSGTYTVATLPTASSNKGARAFVTDATSPTFLGALTGSGTVVCPVFSNGTAWVAG
jgi:hypothetical protein